MRKKEEMSEQDEGEKTGGWGNERPGLKKKINQVGKKKSKYK